MVESIKTLCDLFTDLFKERKQGKREVFESYATPLYEGTKKVFDDYLALFAEMKRMAEQEAELEVLLNLIDQRRHNMLSVRVELRAIIHGFASHSLAGESKFPPFESAILGILSGAFTWAHTLGHFRNSLKMCIIEAGRPRRNKRPPPQFYLKQFVAQIDEQTGFLEAQFKTVANEYAAMRAQQTPRHRLERKKTKVR